MLLMGIVRAGEE